MKISKFFADLEIKINPTPQQCNSNAFHIAAYSKEQTSDCTGTFISCDEVDVLAILTYSPSNHSAIVIAYTTVVTPKALFFTLDS